MDSGGASNDALSMEAPHCAVAHDEAGIPSCSVPGCGNVSKVRREIAEPLEWELGELEPFTEVAFLCAEHIGGVEASEYS
jgi:hypothetical protein